MSRIKGRYVAQIIIDYNANMSEPGRATIKEAKENLKGLSDAIKTIIYEEIIGEENGSIEIVEMLNDFVEVTE